MSIKRRATTDLNHENWDQEEKDEKEMGSYKIASEDVLEKRVIRTAKRRFQNLGDEAKKPVFSGFGGFNKTQPSSFDFLANLTNGSKPNTSATASSNTTTASSVSTNLFGNISSSSIFSTPTSNATKPTFGKFGTESTPMFGASTTSPAASIFTPKTDSVTKNDNPFKTPVTSTFASTSFNSKPTEAINTQPSSTIFGVASSSSNNNKTLFTPSSTAFQGQPLSSTSPQRNNSKNTESESKNKDSTTDSDKGKDKPTKSKLNYYSKLKGLNESVSDWIKKHVEEVPLCILTPIFQGYENHLKKIQEEFENDKKEEEKANANDSLSKRTNEDPPAKSLFMLSTPVTNSGTSPSVNATLSNTPKSIFGAHTTQSSNFSYGFTSTPGTNTTSSGFTFGSSSTQSTSTTTSPFVMSNATQKTNGKPSFSFGSDKPFSFNSNIQVESTEKSTDNKDEEDEPPKVDFTPIAEENSVFDKRCKIFIKKDGNFVDKGVGTLYIKKIQDSDKHQLLVRANTNLGNVLLNLVLSSAIPTQLMGKNNVMMVCIPSPDAKPPPVPILIRVKTSEEAEELLNTLNKFKA